MAHEYILMAIVILSVLGIGIWAITYLVQLVINRLNRQDFAKTSAGKILITLINYGSKVVLILILINLLIPYLPIPNFYLSIIEKITNILLIISVAWIIAKISIAIKLIILSKYSHQLADSPQYKKIRTQITVIEKIIITIIIIITTAIILMTFDRMREIGRTLLASAGVIGVITTFAANKTLSSLFSGFQIAITQPIRIDDSIIIEGEYGEIEDITLTYVVVKLWDLRRLILPINYFIDKPFQNWTYESKNLLGIVNLYVDYSLPLNEIRIQFANILETTPLWDKQLGKLQVSDTTDKIMEIRLFISANNAGDLWDLRCLVREGMIDFIQKSYPDCLPKLRIHSIYS